ncbi:hypothetical protein JCM33374_g1119 [Metschnikowia sp. JCM 33374]|nr:hypothetical protein JCM33374_g1119 [Metschnikowia sp. JCM 33374]
MKIFRKLKRRLSSAGDSMSIHSMKEEEDFRNVEIPDEIYNLKIVLVALTAASAAVIIGYDAGFIGGTVSLTAFKQEFGLDKMSVSGAALIEANVVSVFQAGAYFGCLFFYPIGEIFGRKIGLLLSGFLLTFGAAISLISNSSRGLGGIYAGRVLTAIRGKLVGLWEVSWQVGGIIGYWINYGVLQTLPISSKQWIIPFAIQLVPSGLFWGLCLLIPESPRFLVSKGKIDKARKNLAYLRGLDEDHPYSIFEMENIGRAIDENFEKTGRGFFDPLKALFFSRTMLYRLLLSTSLFMMQNGFGINAITYYSPTIFKSLGVQGSNAGLLSTGIFGILKGAASVFWVFFLVDTFGRRFCLCYLSIPCTICMWYIGAYIKIANPSGRLAAGDTSTTPGGTAAKAMIYIWTIFYGITWNGTSWVICAEIFPQSVRTAASAVNASSNWFWAFMIGHFTGQALENIGYGYYFLFASCSAIFPIVVWFVYPETKGIPLEAVDYLFEVRPWKAHQYAMEKYEIEYNEGKFHRHDDEMLQGSNTSEVEVATSEDGCGNEESKICFNDNVKLRFVNYIESMARYCHVIYSRDHNIFRTWVMQGPEFSSLPEPSCSDAQKLRVISRSYFIEEDKLYLGSSEGPILTVTLDAFMDLVGHAYVSVDYADVQKTLDGILDNVYGITFEEAD